MNMIKLSLAGEALRALGSGALWWPGQSLLCVSDLHLGKSDRIARRGGTLLPPFETKDTLQRLQSDIEATNASVVVCLGDSFDDLAAADSLDEADLLWLTRLQAGRRWIWIEGNHDPGPVDLGGEHLSEYRSCALVFRHIASPDETGEISGHYHPKAQIAAKGRSVSRPCFLADDQRIIMPAYGTYTGGLRCVSEVLQRLTKPNAIAILTGSNPLKIPMPRL
jgi:DNA ligase-associated metallophosphoesterase